MEKLQEEFLQEKVATKDPEGEELRKAVKIIKQREKKKWDFLKLRRATRNSHSSSDPEMEIPEGADEIDEM